MLTIKSLKANKNLTLPIVNNIYEGITISHPKKIHSDFKIFAYNSNNDPLVLFAEENANHGRIIMDFGFRKLHNSYWGTAGTF